MSEYTVWYFDGRRDPETGEEEWFVVRKPDATPLFYTDRLVAEAVAHALVYTGHCVKTRIFQRTGVKDYGRQVLEVR